jgi:uncharacterized protein YcgI (DUF1989 family)
VGVPPSSTVGPPQAPRCRHALLILTRCYIAWLTAMYFSPQIPPCDGRAVKVRAGQLFRVVCTHGPQVADVNFWNAANPAERFYTSKTRQLHASHLTTFDRLWSNMPYLRPLATITRDTIAYGFDEDNASVHDCIGSRCVPSMWQQQVTAAGCSRCIGGRVTR